MITSQWINIWGKRNQQGMSLICKEVFFQATRERLEPRVWQENPEQPLWQSSERGHLRQNNSFHLTYLFKLTCQCLPVKSYAIENEGAREPIKVHEESLDPQTWVLHNVQDCPFPEFRNCHPIIFIAALCLTFDLLREAAWERSPPPTHSSCSSWLRQQG